MYAVHSCSHTPTGIFTFILFCGRRNPKQYPFLVTLHPIGGNDPQNFLEVLVSHDERRTHPCALDKRQETVRDSPASQRQDIERGRLGAREGKVITQLHRQPECKEVRGWILDYDLEED